MIIARNKLFALLLIFFTNIVIATSSIYSNTLFLTNYPTSDLALFLMIQTMFVVLVSLVLTPFLIKNIQRNSVLVILLLSLISIFGFLFLNFNQLYIPFIVAIFIGLISYLMPVISWNLLPAAFGLREYKSIIIYFNVGATIGGIIGSFQASGMLNHLPLNSLLIILIIFLTLCALAAYLLPLIDQPKSIAIKNKINPFHYPLVITLMVFVIGTIAIQYLIDYAFKFQLGTSLSKNEIGIFMGYFLGVTNILGFLSSFTMSKYFIRLFKIDGLLYTYPLFTTLAGLLVVFFPTLWPICILASSRQIIFFNQNRVGIDVVLNILPSAVRTASHYLLKSIISPLTALLVLIFLLVTKNSMTMRSIAVLIVLIAIACLYLVKQIMNHYKITLQAEGEFKRFNLIEEINPANAKDFKDFALNMVHSKNEDQVVFAINIFRRLKLNYFPNELYSLLNHPNFLIRKMVIKTIRKLKVSNAIPLLLKQFEIENDPEIKLNIIDILAEWDLATALKIANIYIADPTNIMYVSALEIYLSTQDNDKRTFAISELRKMIKHPSPLVRKQIASIIGHYHLRELKDCLGELIKDEENSVSETAIKAAANNKMFSLVSIIIEQLNNEKLSYVSKSALVRFGPSITPLLLQYYPTVKNKIIIIKILGEIMSYQTNTALLTLYENNDVYIRNVIVKEILFHACTSPPTIEFKDLAKKFCFEELAIRDYYLNLLTQHSQPAILAEINSRIQLTNKRCLMWLAIATQPKEISKLIPSLLTSTTDVTYQHAKEKALELLEIYIDDIQLKEKMLNLFEGTHAEDRVTTLPYIDNWIDWIIETPKEQRSNMDILMKVFHLRKIALFKELASEILIAIAEEAQEFTFNEGQIIFAENDLPNGLYCITSGKVNFTHLGKELSQLEEDNFFGELALLDDSVRVATAIAATDCTLLFLEKSTFDRIADDLPEVLRAIIKVLIRYLRQNMKTMDEVLMIK